MRAASARALLMLAPQIGIVFHTPCTWNYYPSHLSMRRDDLRLSCLLAHALMPLESIADLSDAIQFFDYPYITSGHILSRIYNCTKPGNRPIDTAATAYFTLRI